MWWHIDGWRGDSDCDNDGYMMKDGINENTTILSRCSKKRTKPIANNDNAKKIYSNLILLFVPLQMKLRKN